MFAEFDQKIKNIESHFCDEIKKLRTGRVSTSIVESISVLAYGAQMPISHISNIMVADAKLLIIEPYDKSLLKGIEKAIVESKINLTPVIDGNVLRLRMPDLTEETRKSIVKILNEKLEESRIATRHARDELKKKIEQDQRDGNISEDKKYNSIEDLNKKTKEAIQNLEATSSAKEKEIMTV